MENLLERDEQLRTIEAGFVAADHAGVVLLGAPGIGKTRLARSVSARLEATGHRTGWVSGSRSAASVPFGAMSHLLPEKWPSGADRVATLRAVVEQVAAWGGRQRAVLCVDDAHLLDDASATAVSHLAVHGAAYVVLTTDDSAPLADSLVALWKDGLVRCVPVPPLSPSAVDELLGRALGSPVDGLTRRWLHTAAAGNPMVLLELVQAGVESGTLRSYHGVWRQHRAPVGTPRLAQLMADRLAALDPAAYAVLELAACAEPVPLQLVDRFADRAALAAAESAGVVRVDGAVLRTAHPLCAAVARAAVPACRANEIQQRLVDSLSDMDDVDPLQAAQWQLAAGRITRPDLLLPAARLAYDRFELELAERLARLAVDSGQSRLLLAGILERRGHRTAAAEALPPPPADGAVEWAVVRATIAYWGQGQVAQAEQALTLAGGHGKAEACRVAVQLCDGRCDEALALALRVGEARGHDIGPGAVAAGLLGRSDAVAALSGDGAGYGACAGSLALGQLSDATARAEDGYRSAIAAAHPAPVVGGWAALRGLCALARGRAVDAVRCLTEAVVLLADQDAYKLVRPTLSALAGATALTGDADGAIAWLARADAAAPAGRLFAAWEELDRAWVLAAIGDLTRARDRALSAAELARSTRQPAFEARALYDAARFGAVRAVHSRLAELATVTGGPVVAIYALAAAGLATADSAALERAATAFHELGFDLLAAEVSATAAREQARVGRPNRAAQLAERMTAYLDGCEVTATPLLSGHRTSTLTSRERQVAMLARQHSSREIANRLGLALNTVNNYLARAYLKLGVTSRRELAAVIEIDRPGIVRPLSPS
jgi:DNA-binding CsgD family transcriptional regulator